MLRTVPLSIIKSFSLHSQKWYRSYRFVDSLRAGSSCFEQDHPDPARKLSAKPVWTHAIAVCTVKNSWWWTEEMSETCWVLFQKNKFEKLVHLVCFIIRIYHDARSSERQVYITSVWNIPHSKKNSVRYHKCTYFST